MKRLQGKAISPGYAAGKAVLLAPRDVAIPRRAILPSEVRAEIERFESALARSSLELVEIRDRVLRQLGKEHSGIFEAHLAILRDPKFSAQITDRIERDLINAEQAVDAEVAEICEQFAQAAAPYLQERQQDVRDVGRRLLGHLVGTSVVVASSLPPRSVLVAHELFPSDTINVDRAHLAAIVTQEGGVTSHAAILARALGVPSVTGIDRLLQQVQPGLELLVDGEAGEVVLSPSGEETAQFAIALHCWQEDQARDAAAESAPCSTTDGIQIGLWGNVAWPDEARQVVAHNLDGIGLLRTEFLFLDAVEAPTLDFQVDVYRQIAESVQPRPTVIRTLDMSGDKHPRFLAAEFDHRLLAFRGLRFSLKERKLFSDQVAAIVRVAKDHDVRILLPMVIDPRDVVRAIELIEDHSQALALTRRPLLGVMVETPAAVMLFDRLIELADFVSVGTNDLTQYVLAADRSAIDADEDYSVLHPAVLQSIQRLVKGCEAANKPISICGEAAGDPKTACLLAGIGVRQFSMSPVRAAAVRRLLCGQAMTCLRQLAQDALSCASTGDVRRLLDNLSGATISPGEGRKVTPSQKENCQPVLPPSRSCNSHHGRTP